MIQQEARARKEGAKRGRAETACLRRRGCKPGAAGLALPVNFLVSGAAAAAAPPPAAVSGTSSFFRILPLLNSSRGSLRVFSTLSPCDSFSDKHRYDTATAEFGDGVEMDDRASRGWIIPCVSLESVIRRWRARLAARQRIERATAFLALCAEGTTLEDILNSTPSLPDDVASIVASFSDAHGLCVMRLVSKGWRQHAENSKLWHRLLSRDFHIDPTTLTPQPENNRVFYAQLRRSCREAAQPREAISWRTLSAPLPREAAQFLVRTR